VGLLGLAHAIERQIQAGAFKDYSDVARHYGLTRARVTQLPDLTLLAPDIQERILFAESVDEVEPTSERGFRCQLPQTSARLVLVQRRPPGLPPKCPAAGRPRGGS
jgi:hypothetical protein